MAASDPDDTSLADRALDYLVYVPVGLALEARELVPRLAERGRGQIALARLVGTIAVKRGRREAEQFLARTMPKPNVPDLQDTAAAPESSELLPIPDYPDLTAAQVVPLLSELDAAELDQVAAYETANRARRTVLGRIDQLRR